MDNIMSKVIDLCEKHIGEFRIRGGEAVAKTCPFCHGGDHNDSYTFAVSLHTGAYNCMRGMCGKKGSLKELCNYFGVQAEVTGNMSFLKSSKKSYCKPDESKLRPVTEEIVTYFATRKISEDTVKAFRIAADEHNNIVFPFYNAHGDLTYVKYRKPKKYMKGDGPKEWSERDTEPILFGMDMVSYHKPLVITEGELDAMSVYESGVHNVVSVPSGCNNLEFVTICWDWLEQFNQIIIFGDNDDPGVDMMNTLLKRLGEDRCMLPQEYPELVIDGKDYNRACKDANEILFAYGPETLKSIVEACEPAPIKGVLNLASVPFVDPTSLPRIFTKIPALDSAIGGLGEGGVTVFTGKRGQGKSTMNGQLLLNAIQQGYKVCAYSGELSAYKFLEWIMLQATESKYIGIKTDARSGKNYPVVSIDIQQRIKQWIDGKFYLFDNAYIDDAAQQEAILKVFTICARRYGCKLFLVDNLMIALTSTDDENKAQAKFAAALKAFAVKYKAHVILVAHPRKTRQGELITNDDVSGSSAITNLADNVISVNKPNLQITKNRDFGVLDYITCNFDPANRRIYQASTGDRTVYGWNHQGIQLPEYQAASLPDFAIQTGEPQYASAQPF